MANSNNVSEILKGIEFIKVDGIPIYENAELKAMLEVAEKEQKKSKYLKITRNGVVLYESPDVTQSICDEGIDTENVI